MPTTLKKVLVLLAAASLVLAGCAGSDQAAVDDDPQAALDAALDNLAEWGGITVELSVQSTTDSLTALAEGELNDERAQQILDSSIAITAKEAQDAADQQVEVVGNIAGQDRSFEMKMLGTTLFVRADIDSLVETFGLDRSDLEGFRAQYGNQPGFEFMGSLLDGEWVAMTGAEQLTGGGRESPTESEAAMVEELTKALKQNTSVTAGDKEGPGGHLIVRVTVRNLVQDFRSVLESVEAFGGAAGQLPDTQEVPDEELVVDAWVEDEQLTQLELDITQFADWEEADFPEGVDDLRLRVALEEFTGEIEEPEAAAEVDLGQLMQLFLEGATGSGSGEGAPAGGGNEALCNELEASLEGQPDEVIDQMRQQYGSICPNLGR